MSLKPHHWAIAGALSVSMHGLVFLGTGPLQQPAADLSAGEPAVVWGIATSELVETVSPVSQVRDAHKPLDESKTLARALSEEAVTVVRAETIEDVQTTEHLEPVDNVPTDKKREMKTRKTPTKKASLGGPVGKPAGNQGASLNSTQSRAAAATYSARVLSHLRRYKRHPGGSTNGTVKLAFTVASSGALRSVRITGGSGSTSLRNAALAMVRRASPFPSFPQDLQKPSMTFSIPVKFNR